MTDGALSLAGVVVPQIGLGDEGPGEEMRDDLDIATRVRAWHLECVRSPFWLTYSDEAEEDLEYYVGGEGQWTKQGDATTLQRLKTKGRATISLNLIQAPLDALSGYQRQNRSDAIAKPQGDEDTETARLYTWLLKHVQDQCHAQDSLSDVFEDGAIGGMHAAEVGIDWTKGTRGGVRRAGVAYVEPLKPGLKGELLWDPRWKEYGCQDARFFLRYRWVSIADLEAQYPKHKDLFSGALARLDAQIAGAEAGQTTVRLEDYPDEPGTHMSVAEVEEYFYHRLDRTVLVLDAWYRVWDEEWCVCEQRTGRMIPFEGRKLQAVEYAALDPDRLKVERQIISRVRMSTIVPATLTTLERDTNPYPNDDEDYPFAVFVVKRKGRHAYGLVRNLKDPQRVENKRMSQLLDMIDRFVRLRALIEEESLVDPHALADPLDDSPIRYKRDRQKPDWFVPPIAQLAPVLTGLAEQINHLMRQISGINTDLLGMRSDDASGIAIRQRISQGQVVATVFFDRFRRTQQYAFERLARRTEQLYKADEIVRLTGDLGQDVLVRLNPAGAPEAGEDRKSYLEQVRAYRTQYRAEHNGEDVLPLSNLRYDVVIAEGPSTPTARATALMAVLDIVRSVPALGPFFLSTIVKLADIPDRDQILQQIQAMTQRPAGPPAAGGPPMSGSIEQALAGQEAAAPAAAAVG